MVLGWRSKSVVNCVGGDGEAGTWTMTVVDGPVLKGATRPIEDAVSVPPPPGAAPLIEETSSDEMPTASAQRLSVDVPFVLLPTPMYQFPSDPALRLRLAFFAEPTGPLM